MSNYFDWNYDGKNLSNLVFQKECLISVTKAYASECLLCNHSNGYNCLYLKLRRLGANKAIRWPATFVKVFDAFKFLHPEMECYTNGKNVGLRKLGMPAKGN